MPEDVRVAVYANGAWEIDLGRRELRRAKTVMPLGGRAFDLLEAIAGAEGEVIESGELMRRVWARETVAPNTLHVHAAAIRKAFGTEADFLKTVSGRGYRLSGQWTKARLRHGSDTRPASAAMPARTNLPAIASGLIGRARAMQRIRDMMTAYRIVTLVGPGGIGKTRLALEVATTLHRAMQIDTWWVELGTVTDPELVPSTISGVVGLAQRSEGLPAMTPQTAIGDRSVILVLDNCEHVIDAVAAVVDQVVRNCRNCQVLVTSQEMLRVHGEAAFRVPPLEVPSERPEPAETLAASSAVQMFQARAAMMLGNTPRADDDLDMMARICRRLDGIPLAIEFAAAQAATLGLREVLERLDDRFDLLTRGRRTALPRHRTLRATLDWSYALLPAAEQRMLRLLGLFAGGFTLDAAVAVIDAPAAVVADGISDLVAKSLLDLAVGVDGRWRLLETTRAYALERLAASGEGEPAARRYCDFYAAFVAENTVHQPDDRLPAGIDEIDNLRSALRWAATPDAAPVAAARLAIGMAPILMHLSLMAECQARAEQALALLASEDGATLGARMQLKVAIGWSLAYRGSRSREAGAVWAEAAALARRLGDIPHLLRALWGLWISHLEQSRFRESLGFAEDFAGHAGASGRYADLIAADRMRGASLHYLGDQGRARVHIEASLERYVALGAARHTARFYREHAITAKRFHARILWLQGDFDAARVVMEEMVAAEAARDHAITFGAVLGHAVCPIVFLHGDMVAARRYGAMLQAHARRHDLQAWARWADCFLGFVTIGEGALTEGLAMVAADLEALPDGTSNPRYLLLHAVHAEALGRAGDIVRGSAIVRRLRATCEANGEAWLLPELIRVDAELIRMATPTDATGRAAGLLHQAIALSERQSALALTLRATLSLARLQPGPEAVSALARVVARFAQGVDMPDLRAARRLIAEAGALR